MENQSVEYYLESLNEFDFSSLRNKLKAPPEKIVEKYKNSISLTENYLRKKGINIKLLKKDIEKLTNRTNGMLTAEDIKPVIKKHMQGIAEQYSSDPTVFEKIGNSIVLFILVLVVNSVVASILLGVTKDPLSTMFISATIIAPVVEEYAKKVAIEQGFGWTFASVFSGIEGLGYIAAMVSAGLNPAKAVVIRILAMLMHFSTTWVQTTYQDNARTDEERKEKAYDGYRVGVVIHSVWNAMGIILNEPLSTWARS